MSRSAIRSMRRRATIVAESDICVLPPETSSYRLWLLLNLEIWHEIYIEGRSVDVVTDDIQRLVSG